MSLEIDRVNIHLKCSTKSPRQSLVNYSTELVFSAKKIQASNYFSAAEASAVLNHLCCCADRAPLNVAIMIRAHFSILA